MQLGLAGLSKLFCIDNTVRGWDELIARDTSGALVNLFNSTPDGDFWIVDSQVKGAIGLDASAGRKPEEFKAYGLSYKDLRPGSYDPAAPGNPNEPLLKKMSAFPAPTFAAAHGACLGVGLGLLIATDVVYVADTAKIGSPFANLGATLDSGGHALFVERLGAHRTLDLIYTAELMSGAEAVRSGLFSRSVPAPPLYEQQDEPMPLHSSWRVSTLTPSM